MRHERLRAKLYRTRRLSLQWIRSGGEPHELVEPLRLFQALLVQGKVRAGERVLDGLLARLRQRGETSASSDHASAA
jgi:hypothetical protein